MAKTACRIALMEGDGIGKEVLRQGVRVLEAAARKSDLPYRFDDFDFASCDYYEKTGQNASSLCRSRS